MRRILVVDNDKGNLDVLVKSLNSDGHSVQNAGDSEAALHRFRAWKPHLIILSVDLESINVFDILQKIRTLMADEYTGVILMSGKMNLDEVKKALEVGADDYLSLPLRLQDLLARVRAILRMKETQDSLRRANHRIEELSSTDDLTGLMNMRAAYRKGEEEIVRSKRFRKPVSSLLLNLDGFSHINQSYGFTTGSHILQEVAVRVKQCLRSIDLIARVGADEFFIILTDTDLASAEFMAERVRDSIQSSPFKNDKQTIKLTATIGVAGLTHDQANQRMSDLLHFATEALRSAKANGNNRIEVYSFT
jgi:diguanylate cyclase (GGDEF)-like protein